jgi:hypothetical protein
MIARSLRFALIALPLALAACGDLPEPFLGNPGATARRLAQPPSPILAVPAPADALLPDEPGHQLAENLATALVTQEVPAVQRSARKTDWRLETRAERRGDTVVPLFTVRDPNGADEGNTEGAAIPLSLWAEADPGTLRAAAADAAPKIAAVLTSIRVARDRADPHSLYNRAAKVMVADVTGAPGDGDAALTSQMRKRLAVYGPIVQTTPAGADFIVRGNVVVVPLPKRQERVEIQWVVTGTDGSERGRVVQLNEIPAGTLDRLWGDVAAVVATEASGGINKVLQRQSGRDPDAQAAAQPGQDAGSRVAPAADGTARQQAGTAAVQRTDAASRQ